MTKWKDSPEPESEDELWEFDPNDPKFDPMDEAADEEGDRVDEGWEYRFPEDPECFIKHEDWSEYELARHSNEVFNKDVVIGHITFRERYKIGGLGLLQRGLLIRPNGTVLHPAQKQRNIQREGFDILGQCWRDNWNDGADVEEEDNDGRCIIDWDAGALDDIEIGEFKIKQGMTTQQLRRYERSQNSPTSKAQRVERGKQNDILLESLCSGGIITETPVPTADPCISSS